VVHVDKLKPYVAESDEFRICPKVTKKNETISCAAEDEIAQDESKENDVTSESDEDELDPYPSERPRRQLRLPARYRE
jgi:hypothetical protein